LTTARSEDKVNKTNTSHVVVAETAPLGLNRRRRGDQDVARDGALLLTFVGCTFVPAACAHSFIGQSSCTSASSSKMST
jgi:hypothetical protein